MSLDLSDAALARAHAKLTPYAAWLVARAADVALFVHAEEVTPEHLLSALMDDESSAAHRAVLFAFADPETIAVEALATAPGILVVGSECTLPFSVRGVEALRAARGTASAEGASAVAPSHLLRGAVGALEPDQASALAGAGYRDPGAEPAAERALVDEGALFRSFTEEARRLLAQSARAARKLGRDAIGPVHLALVCLERAPELAQRAGLRGAAARAALAGRDADPTPVPPREIPPGGELVRFLRHMPEGAGSLELLGAYLEHAAPQLVDLLQKNRITQELLARARAGFRDPDPPS